MFFGKPKKTSAQVAIDRLTVNIELNRASQNEIPNVAIERIKAAVFQIISEYIPIDVNNVHFENISNGMMHRYEVSIKSSGAIEEK